MDWEEAPWSNSADRVLPLIEGVLSAGVLQNAKIRPYSAESTCVLGAFGGSITCKRGIIDGDALALDGHYVGIG